MQRHTDPALTRLPAGALMSLPRGAGQGIAVFNGLIWLTQEGDRRDHFLTAGDSLPLRSEGRVVMQAIGATQLMVYETAASMAEAA
jgi:Protein of unknown function (DUF2917)